MKKSPALEERLADALLVASLILHPVSRVGPGVPRAAPVPGCVPLLQLLCSATVTQLDPSFRRGKIAGRLRRHKEGRGRGRVPES